jgi:SAM-dependent methyltransferase
MENTSNTPIQLSRRLDCNASSSRDLNDFIFRITQPCESDVALDIGCGSGKQLKEIAKRVKTVIGVDISSELIDTIKTSLPEQNNVQLLVGSMDYLADLDLKLEFTLIYSAYSLYYSKDIEKLVTCVRSLLKGNGSRCFVVAPDVDNNAEWFDDLRTIFELPEDILTSPWVSREKILPALLNSFSEVHCYHFENDVEFKTVGDLMKYYDGCGSYCRHDKREDAALYFRERFQEEGKYTMRKIALGMLGIVR